VRPEIGRAGARSGAHRLGELIEADAGILAALGYRDPSSLDPPKTWVGRHLPDRRADVAAWEEAKA
jgi:hypothetical protein